MELDNILSVSGMPGLYKLVTTRSNGLIIEDFDSGKKTFISMRKHQFTPLESIGIYTYTDVAEIKHVFAKIDEHAEQMPDASAPGTAFHNYFREILPDYDENRVYLSDIKKLVKWYGFLKERNLLAASDTSTSDEEE